MLSVARRAWRAPLCSAMPLRTLGTFRGLPGQKDFFSQSAGMSPPAGSSPSVELPPLRHMLDPDNNCVRPLPSMLRPDAAVRGTASPAAPPSVFQSVGSATSASPLGGSAFTEKKHVFVLDAIEFDANGDVRALPGKFTKTDLCAQHGLQPRDLRTIDQFKSQTPAILVRSHSLVVNLEHIRAIIKADMVVVFDPQDAPDRPFQAQFIYDLQERLRLHNSNSPDALPYELRALEAVLLSVCNMLREQYNQLSPKAAAVLRRMEGNIDKALLLNMLNLSKQLTRFETRVTGVRDAMNEILDTNDDMAGMYLTYRERTGSAKPAEQHEEVEFMFEFYVKQVDELAVQVAELISNIRSTQSIVKIELDSQRNALMQLETRVTIATFAASLGSLGASVFGMNLMNSMEASATAFWVVAGGLVSVSAVTFTMLMFRMKWLVRTVRRPYLQQEVQQAPRIGK